MTRPMRLRRSELSTPGLEREDDGQGGGQRRRPGVPRPRGRRRARRQGGGPGPDRRGPQRPRLGHQDAGRAHQRRRTRRGATTTSSRSSPGAGADLDVIIIPKVKAPRDVWFVETLLDQLEAKLGLEPGRIGLEVLIEETEALARVEEIAGCSRRLEALILGVGDLSASQGIRAGHIGESRRPLPRRHVALRPQPDDRGRPGQRPRRDRRPLRQLPQPRRLPARGHLGGHARCRRQVGDPPEPDRDRQRGLRPHRGRGRPGPGASSTPCGRPRRPATGAANLDGMMIDAATARIFEPSWTAPAPHAGLNPAFAPR